MMDTKKEPAKTGEIVTQPPKDVTALTKVEHVEMLQKKYGFDAQDVNVICSTVAKGATMQELVLFLHQCKKTGLDPLAKQIYFVKYGKANDTKITIQTSIDGLRTVAVRTKQYAGNDDYLFNNGLTQYDCHVAGIKKPTTATATVYRIIGGQRVAFTATADWEAYYPADEKKQFMWKKYPFLMLGKCAESLALRKAFPQDLSGIYSEEEIGQPIFTGTIEDPGHKVSKERPEKKKPETDWIDTLKKKLSTIKLTIEGETEQSLTPEKKLTFLLRDVKMPTDQKEAQQVYTKLVAELNKK